MQVPETIILLARTEVYKLIEKQKSLDLSVEYTRAEALKAVECAENNKSTIKELAQFLQEQCPDAVKGTWFQELELE